MVSAAVLLRENDLLKIEVELEFSPIYSQMGRIGAESLFYFNSASLGKCSFCKVWRASGRNTSRSVTTDAGRFVAAGLAGLSAP